MLAQADKRSKMQIAGGCCHLFFLDHLPLAISAPKSPIFMFAEKAATQKLKSALDENQQNPTISWPLYTIQSPSGNQTWLENPSFLDQSSIKTCTYRGFSSLSRGHRCGSPRLGNPHKSGNGCEPSEGKPGYCGAG